MGPKGHILNPVDDSNVDNVSININMDASKGKMHPASR